ncbi:MAG: sulfite exporter TauE/SafE family protein [Gammaproteobacteria bacterium]
MDWSAQLALLAASLVANVFSAFAGGGAGLLQLPIIIFLGLPFGVALATHKIATVALGVGATVRHWREGSFDRKFTLVILCAGVPGVALGASFILLVPGRTAEVALGMITLALGAYSYLRPSLGQSVEPINRDVRGLLAGSAVIFLVGLFNGSLSSGSGLFLTLWLVRWFGLDYRRAVAYTMVLGGMFWNGTGALTLVLLGDVRWSWLPALLLGALVGGYLGAHLSILKGNRWIKRVYEAVTVAMGVSLIWGL